MHGRSVLIDFNVGLERIPGPTPGDLFGDDLSQSESIGALRTSSVRKNVVDVSHPVCHGLVTQRISCVDGIEPDSGLWLWRRRGV